MSHKEDNFEKIKEVFNKIIIKDELAESSTKYLTLNGFVFEVHHKGSRPTVYSVDFEINQYGFIQRIILDTITKIDGVDLPSVKEYYPVSQPEPLIFFANKVLSYPGTGTKKETDENFTKLGCLYLKKK